MGTPQLPETLTPLAALRMISIATARTSFESSSVQLRELADLTVARRRWKATERSGVRSKATSVASSNLSPPMPPLSILASTARACRRARLRSRTERISSATAAPKPANPKLPSCGRRGQTTTKGDRARLGLRHLKRSHSDHRVVARDADAEPVPSTRRVLREAERRGFGTAAHRGILRVRLERDNSDRPSLASTPVSTSNAPSRATASTTSGRDEPVQYREARK